MIEVRLFATFREGWDKVVFLDAAKHADAMSVLVALEIDPAEVAILLINGRHRKPDALVNDGDVLALFPPVGGG